MKKKLSEYNFRNRQYVYIIKIFYIQSMDIERMQANTEDINNILYNYFPLV